MWQDSRTKQFFRLWIDKFCVLRSIDRRKSKAQNYAPGQKRFAELLGLQLRRTSANGACLAGIPPQERPKDWCPRFVQNCFEESHRTRYSLGHEGSERTRHGEERIGDSYPLRLGRAVRRKSAVVFGVLSSFASLPPVYISKGTVAKVRAAKRNG